MKASKYIQMPEKDFVQIYKIFKTQCCDCGLVHLWEFHKPKGKPFGFIITRDNRATGQIRKNKKIRRIS